MTIVYDIKIQSLTVGTKYDSENEAAFYQKDNPNLQVDSSHGDHIKCVSHPTQSGLKALELFVQKSPNSFSKELHKGRAEIVSPYDLGPSDYYVGFRIMFPSDFPAGAREFIFIQGGNYAGQHPNVTAQISGDELSFKGGGRMPFERNRWYAMEYRIKMSTSSSQGKFQVWVDGALKADNTLKTAYTDAEGADKTYVWKLGIYAYNWRANPDVGPDKYRYFVDHMKMATTRAEVAYSAPTPLTIAPTPPTIAMTTPASGSQLTVGKPTALKATASIATGTITKVEFYSPVNPTSILGTDTSPTRGQCEVSYAFTSPGTKQIVAKAYGSNGTTTQSSAFTYTAVIPDTTPPTVAMQPIQILVGEAIRLVASAGDNVKVSKVEFFGTNAAGDIPSGAKPLTTGSVAPYQGSYAFSSVGTKHVVAVATDTTANKTKSAPISFKVYQ